MTTGAGIAIAGIWIGVAGIAHANAFAGLMAGCLAAMATMAITYREDQNEP